MRDPLRTVFLLFEEGIPDDQLVERIRALTAEEFRVFLDHLSVYRENVADDAAIPEDIVDDEGIYARMREHGREYAQRLERLLRRLADPLR
jgi:hypothetical protein